ncbi:MAG: hypothetical protein B6U69_04090 [Thermofilum sp. ex4484_15]|nr:MAG: hypothetical protein B6U69_04090 [Thermofilum sp. ex4484_15]
MLSKELTTTVALLLINLTVCPYLTPQYLDFSIGRYSLYSPSLTIIFKKGYGLRLLVCASPEVKPGFYLDKEGRIIAFKPMLLQVGDWYRLSLVKEGNLVKVSLTALNDTWIATRIDYLPTFYKQGIAFGKKSIYFTGTSILIKLSLSKEVINYNADPIPNKLKDEGYFHLGDLDYYNGSLYIPVEREGYERPAVIAIYDTDELKMVSYFYTPQDHMPWLAVDGEGLIYTSEYSPVSEILVYNVRNLKAGSYIKPVKSIKLNRTLGGVQGGAFYRGRLYLSVMDGWIYEVDLSTGTVRRLFKLPDFYEMEGMDVYELADGTLYHVLINTNLNRNLVYHLTKLTKGQRLALFTIKGEVGEIVSIIKPPWVNSTLRS